jgi:integration host factor subunit alpha
MTKSEIVNAVYSKVGGFSKKEAADIVELVFETVKETLGRGEKIKISGFGNFVLRDKRQRRGRNPQTGQPLTITERRVLTFKASQILKSILNPEDEVEGAAPPAAAAPQTQSGSDGRRATPSNGAHGAAAPQPSHAARPIRQSFGQGERR